jgi:predicted O-methyltransferase YrrM
LAPRWQHPCAHLLTDPAQGDLIYLLCQLLCRALGATRVAEFATSVGMSTLYFAAAIRDNGGGAVIGS